jgi:hypothetical protein
MTTSELLHQLRLRLGTIQHRIAELERLRDTDGTSVAFLAVGEMAALRNEQLFLAGLIEQMGAGANADIESSIAGGNASSTQ